MDSKSTSPRLEGGRADVDPPEQPPWGTNQRQRLTFMYVTTVIKRGDKTKPKDSPQIHAIYLETAKALPIHAKPPPVAPTKAICFSFFRFLTTRNCYRLSNT
jgi:hypothetical protein